jgi:acyl dehydratase
MTATAVSVTIDELPDLEGTTFGPSSWREVTQEEVNLYAKVSGDDNPIHLDAEFAASTPFGTRIAHGLLTLGLVVPHMREIFKVTGVGMGINYGMNKVRFPAPVPVGSRVRVHGRIASVTDIGGGWQLEVPVTFEIEGVEKPACVAELVLRYYK